MCLYKNNLRFYKNISEIVLLLSEIENTAWQIVRTYHAVLKTILVASVGEQVAIVIVPVVIFMINREKRHLSHVQRKNTQVKAHQLTVQKHVS